MSERYAIHSTVGSGGMATVYLGRVRGAAGFARLVAIKKLHEHLARDESIARMFADEARLASRVRHPNVVSTIDVIETDGELLQVLEWIDGESLARLAPPEVAKQRKLVPLPIVIAIMSGVLAGLHAAHEAKNEKGEPLGIVHRDVSPQNIMVGASDGVARVLDFGVAKAMGRDHTTKDGRIRGKIRYMPAEQLEGKPATRANDIYAAGVILWELLTGLPLIESADNEAAIVTQVLTGIVEPPSIHRRPRNEVPLALDDLVMHALDRDPTERFATAREMAHALQSCGVAAATPFEVAEWVQITAKDALATRNELVARVEQEAEEGENDAKKKEKTPALAAHAARRHDGTASRPTAADVPAVATKAAFSLQSPLLAVMVVVTLFVVALVALENRSTVTLTTTAPAARAPAASTMIEPAKEVVPPPPATAPSASASSQSAAIPTEEKPRALAPTAAPPKPSATAPSATARRRDGTEDWK